MAAHQLADVTIVADAGMISDANRRAIEAAGLSFILGTRFPDVPYAVTESKHDLAARPIYHRERESIEAHLSIVFAALAVSRLVEDATGWSIKRFVQPPAATAPSRSVPAPTC